MVKGNIGPFGGFMTGSAVRAELPIMFILWSMTGKTILGRAFIDIIYVAGSTSDIIGVRACQWECGIAMVESYILPTTGVMAR